jgi:hypothetical protein
MAQRIEVPGMGIVEFPDGMTDAQIASAIKANMPKPAEPSGAETLAKQTGFGEAMMVGAGRKTDAILNGITQLYLGAKGDTKALGGLAQNVAEGESLYRPLAKERPFATGLGESLPAMAVPGAGASLLGAMVAGAAPELLSYGSAQERASKGAVGAAGGAIGYGIGGLLNTLIKPAGAGTKVNQGAIDAAERIGFKPMAGQATQNPALLNIENYLARNPGSSGTMRAINQGNQEAINSAAMSSIGQVSKDASPAVLKAAENTLGAEFQRLQSVTAPRLGTDFVDALQKIELANAAKGSFRNPQIDKLIDKGLDLAAQGNLSGQAYKEIRSELSAQANSAFKAEGGATLGQALKTVRSALDDAAEKSLSAADQQAWATARSQWGNWKTLTKGLVAEGGDVSAARVAQQLRSQGPSFRTGSQGPLADVGRIGEGIKGALNPNSGNLPNMMMYGNPITGVPLATGNFIAGKAYTNPLVQAYLRSGLLDIGKNGELIVRATGVPLGIEASKQLLGVE